MIHINLSINNPFSNRFDHVLLKNGIVTKNTAWEFNIYRSATIMAFKFELTSRRDHAGIRFEIGLLGYEVEFHMYDVRHWDNENKCWEVYAP